MALAIMVTLEREVPNVAEGASAKAGNGKALARESDRLDSAARRKGVSAITSPSEGLNTEVVEVEWISRHSPPAQIGTFSSVVAFAAIKDL